MRKKILYLNDCSFCHSGSLAVTKVIIKLLTNLYDNCEIISIKRGDHRNITKFDDIDLIIVNGEGAVHHNARDFCDLLSYIFDIKKPKYLLNSAFYKMTIDKKYLEQFTKIYTREVISHKELLDNYGICSILHLDLSFYYYTFEKEKEYYYNEKFNNKILLTDFNQFSVKIKDVINILKNNNVDYTEYYEHFRLKSWDENINNFKNGKIIITDKQHVMINCIIANAKFIVFTSNIPKNEGILQTLNCKIPIMNNIKQFENELHNFLNGYYDDEFINLFRNARLTKFDVVL